MRNDRKSKLIELLSKAYPNPGSELNFRSPYELTVAVMLSAQCTDKKVNQVTPFLFKSYPDFKSLAQATPRAVEKIIRPINYYRTKAKNLIATAKLLMERWGGKLPRTREKLVECPGIGQKSANVILGELGHAKTFPVDTHVFRLARRLGLSDGKDVRMVEEQLKERFDQGIWRNLHHQLILHGRRICSARSPKCGECILKSLCPSANCF